MERIRVPFVPTPQPVVNRMLELAEIKPREVLYDLGAGDGRFLFTAAEEFGARAVGVEIQPTRCAQIAKTIAKRRLEGLVSVVRSDLMRVRLSDADVVTLYLLPKLNLALKPKLESEVKPSARILCHDFPIPGWKPVYKEVLRIGPHNHTIYVYSSPSRRGMNTEEKRRLSPTGVHKI